MSLKLLRTDSWFLFLFCYQICLGYSHYLNV